MASIPSILPILAAGVESERNVDLLRVAIILVFFSFSFLFGAVVYLSSTAAVEQA